jgi:hypothetical protein
MWKGLCGMDVDLLKAIWNGVEMDMDPYVDPHVDFVAWIRTLEVQRRVEGIRLIDRLEKRREEKERVEKEAT